MHFSVLFVFSTLVNGVFVSVYINIVIVTNQIRCKLNIFSRLLYRVFDILLFRNNTVIILKQVRMFQNKFPRCEIFALSVFVGILSADFVFTCSVNVSVIFSSLSTKRRPRKRYFHIYADSRLTNHLVFRLSLEQAYFLRKLNRYYP